MESNRKKDADQLGSAINFMLNEFNLSKKFKEADLIGSWEDIMGKTIATKTEKIFIHDNKLFLTINSGPLKHQLSLQKTKIIAKLEEKFGEGIVQEVIIR